ncbi:hypothetical protein ATCV1_z052L [Acanthocystis turfacea chlorella virus 1]|uniref:Uncharacterized protein z052L n=1 Tax=Chlorovirus heliozoae TaxID=322019 RepID=A7K812_9PHYC|nr:hypothetical protein ATCV1_z052L [Acanthocystis turfacea chlorella virus 1]ABT16186.1 hypothetical protein ATCV1_z052L [Acanthocystis turfacea chlorella virus 1]
MMNFFRNVDINLYRRFQETRMITVQSWGEVSTGSSGRLTISLLMISTMSLYTSVDSAIETARSLSPARRARNTYGSE